MRAAGPHPLGRADRAAHARTSPLPRPTAAKTQHAFEYEACLPLLCFDAIITFARYLFLSRHSILLVTCTRWTYAYTAESPSSLS